MPFTTASKWSKQWAGDVGQWWSAGLTWWGPRLYPHPWKEKYQVFRNAEEGEPRLKCREPLNITDGNRSATNGTAASPSSPLRLRKRLRKGRWKDRKSHRLVGTSVKQCLLDTKGPRCSGAHGSCGSPENIKPVSIGVGKSSWLPLLTEELWIVDVLGSREWLLFKGVWPRAQWCVDSTNSSQSLIKF